MNAQASLRGSVEVVGVRDVDHTSGASVAGTHFDHRVPGSTQPAAQIAIAVGSSAARPARRRSRRGWETRWEAKPPSIALEPTSSPPFTHSPGAGESSFSVTADTSIWWLCEHGTDGPTVVEGMAAALRT